MSLAAQRFLAGVVHDTLQVNVFAATSTATCLFEAQLCACRQRPLTAFDTAVPYARRPRGLVLPTSRALVAA